MAGMVVVIAALMAFIVLLVTSIATADMVAHMYVFALVYYLVFAIIRCTHYKKISLHITQKGSNLDWNIERQ
jgi:hypothetical protein